jgi:GntR family transcriptional regulator/MocR family aminotransferase
MVISTGFAQGINLVLRALARRGVRRIALEDPGDRDPYALAQWLGIEAIPVAVDQGGIDLRALAAADVRAVLLTPAHQFPTGVLLAPERRHALVAWAAERDATIIEDDYDAEFRYDRRPFEGLQGLAPDRVVALSSVSKTLAPTLRLGWIVAPPRLIEAIAQEKQLDDRGSPGLDQLALARLIESGRYDRHLRRMRALYGDRRCALIDALAQHAPEVEASGLMAGLHAVLHLPDAADEAEIVAAAHARSVGLYGMSRFRSRGATRPPTLVVGFAHLHEAAIARGIAAVADLLRAGPRPARRRRRVSG